MEASPRARALPRPGLLSRLKLETHDLRRQSARSGIMQALLRGQVRRSAYCAFLRNLYEIYAPLENGLRRHHDHPLVHPFLTPGLCRVAALSNDLRVLCGEGWSTEIPLQPAAVAYRDRLNGLAETEPGLLVAHAFVRYLGDLSDGQIVHRLVAEQLRLGEDATRFYQFGTPADVDLLLVQFRNGIDAIPATPEEADSIVAEAQEALRRHITLFDELAGGRALAGS